MKIVAVSKRFLSSFKERKGISFLRENDKIIRQFILTIFFIGVGIWFIKHENSELKEVNNVLADAKSFWVVCGIALATFYIALQALMYFASFKAVQSEISFKQAVILFLKRNFVSVFLPAGGISSLAFFTKPIEKSGVKPTQIHFASLIYGFVGILSVIIVAIPALIYSLFQGTVGSGEWYAFAAIVGLSILVFFIYNSIIKKGAIYRLILKFSPSTEIFIDDFRNNKIIKRKFLQVVFYSVLIEFVGIAHLYVAMIALGFAPSLAAAAMGYIISVIFLIVSPFLRGLGAIEISMSFILIQYGFENVNAIAITFLYRFFEFWIPLLAGASLFLFSANKLLMRVVPSFLLFILGLINIVSVLTPAISERLHVLENVIPISAIKVSNYFVITAGLFMLVNAAFMLKGLRTAWWFAVFLTGISIIGNLTKAIDYEEASIALLVLLTLIFTRKEYYIKSNSHLQSIGLKTVLISIVAVLVYSILGFYFLDKKHFNIDFNWLESIRYGLQNYFLIGSSDLVPLDRFARRFLLSINICGFLSLGFLIFALIRPYTVKKQVVEDDFVTADELVKKYGNSALDYFKTYDDKVIFITADKKSFLAYRVTDNFAVVLENPVAASDAEMKQCIIEFDVYCYENGLRSIYYRVPEESLPLFHSLHKKSLFIGQEGVVDLNTFSLEGGAKKSLRNAISKVKEKGFTATIHNAPVKDGLLQKIKAVSDEWLVSTGRSEIIFSQGRFDWEELKQQTIITVESAEEKIVAFINVIPDYANGEGTYDLIRKTNDAPNGIMDFILLELFTYLKSQGCTSVNLGLAAMSGLEEAETFPEKSMKFAYERIKFFSHYKGLRDFKEKFSPVWYNKYLVYSHDYDLLQAPLVLNKVVKP
ncbi:bifunctional lysylphosphatidylglycerol flippase/synthetase MprF [Flavobacterium quisquiliarum]|uniref:Phosphatidylglycerol lysyltransferase n=1 Tax=Flavobacterium quisquiliarum TaxID=1834436 RepID=A0ABV8W173_9FLAO|nr:bifunctional lysylphosphatidylglycerol flippase/synthetase MprF [Flavobacterium quisquiliarum]MBW1654619.1 bifunctional lysylphosphatidylglycerol flippase/synthetase MprF [Flavobacterium quisquiliarum]NWL01694.1 bifunctional lysylphosphatidylglycerol flippase/synthetase MprF [Flavobacterium collinsii]